MVNMDWSGINIVSWSVGWGLKQDSLWSYGHIKELVRRYKPSFYILLETHVVFCKV